MVVDATSPVVLVRNRWVPDDLRPLLARWTPRTNLGLVVRECFAHLPDDLARELLEGVLSCVVVESSLALVHRRLLNPGADRPLYALEDWGVVSRKVVTDAGVALLVDAFDNTLANADCRYHGLGTGTTAEAAGQTALVTELTTEYNPNSTRATGTFSQPSANISQSVATNTVDATAAVTEHGVFTQAATGGGTMLDRSVFSAVNLASGDSLQSTYSLTLTSGG